MFGFFRPDRKLLSSRYFDANMCIFCNVLAHRYGSKARLILNYESLLLSMILIEISKQKEELLLLIQKHFKRNLKCLIKMSNKASNKALLEIRELVYPIDLSIYLALIKATDDFHDAPSIKSKIQYKFIEKIGIHARENLAKQGLCVEKIDELLSKQKWLENNKSQPLNDYVYPTAESFGHVYAAGSLNPLQQDILRELGYAVGKIIVLVDSMVDYQNDMKDGCYNLIAWSKNLDNNILAKDVAQEINYEIEKSFYHGVNAIEKLGVIETKEIFLAIKENIMGYLSKKFTLNSNVKNLCIQPQKILERRFASRDRIAVSFGGLSALGGNDCGESLCAAIVCLTCLCGGASSGNKETCSCPCGGCRCGCC